MDNFLHVRNSGKTSPFATKDPLKFTKQTMSASLLVAGLLAQTHAETLKLDFLEG